MATSPSEDAYSGRMLTDSSPLISVTIAKRELVAALAPLLVTRNGAKGFANAQLEIAAESGNLRFEGCGATADCAAAVQTAGRLWLPNIVLWEFRKAVRTLPGKKFDLSAGEGFLTVQRYTLRHPGISRQEPPLEGQFDLPPLPIVLELLAFERHVGPARVAEAKMDRQVEEARRDATKRLARAAKLLQPLGMTEIWLARQFEALLRKRSGPSFESLRRLESRALRERLRPRKPGTLRSLD